MCGGLLSHPQPAVPKTNITVQGYEHKYKSKGKVVPVLNEVPRLEDVCGSGSIAPCIPNFGTRWS